MKRIIVFIAALGALSAQVMADGPQYVYELRELGVSASDPWSMNMGVLTDAARLYVPVSFTKAASAYSFTLDATVSFSSKGSVELERSDARVLVRHEVSVRGAAPLPKPDKRLTVRFSLSEVVKKGGSASASPLLYALRKALAGVSYKSGRAWIESATYDGSGRFSIVVAIKKN